MTAVITAEEIRQRTRNAHPVDALVLLRCAEEVERLERELAEATGWWTSASDALNKHIEKITVLERELADVVAHRDSETRWASQYKQERDKEHERAERWKTASLALWDWSQGSKNFEDALTVYRAAVEAGF